MGGKEGQEILTTCQMPINLADASYSSFARNVVPRLVERGIGPLAMKTLAFGQFFKTPAGKPEPPIPGKVSVQEAIHYVWSLPVTALITGAETAAQLQEKIDLAKKFVPLNEAQRAALIQKVAEYAGNKFETYKA